MKDECAHIVPLNPYIASKASEQHLSLCTAYNRFFRRSVKSCLFPMANLYSNWFLKTILSPFRLSLSQLLIAKRRVLKMSVVRLKIYAFICQFSKLPQYLEIHLPEHPYFAPLFAWVSPPYINMPMCLLVPYSPIEFALNRQIASLKRWKQFAVSRSTEGLKALYKWLNVNKKDQLI